MNTGSQVLGAAGSTPTLLGVAVDVSGSMESSIRNNQALDLSRLQGVERGLDSLLEDSRRLSREQNLGIHLPLRIFVYAFGLQWGTGVGDLFGLLKLSRNADFKTFLEASTAKHTREAMRKGEELRRQAANYADVASLARQFGFGGVVDSVQASAETDARHRLEAEAKAAVGRDVAEHLRTHGVDSTLPIQDFAELWAGGSGKLGDARPLIFGGTPMRACLEEMEARFSRERKPGEEQALLLISDGEPTDGDPSAIVQRLKNNGVHVACAYLTDRDVQKPRDMQEEPQPAWPQGAKLLFQMASGIGAAGRGVGCDPNWHDALVKSGWNVPARSKLFVQVNNSETLADFMRVVGTAFPIGDAARGALRLEAPKSEARNAAESILPMNFWRNESADFFGQEMTGRKALYAATHGSQTASEKVAAQAMGLFLELLAARIDPGGTDQRADPWAMQELWWKAGTMSAKFVIPKKAERVVDSVVGGGVGVWIEANGHISTEFTLSYHRLVCTNGMTRKHEAAGRFEAGDLREWASQVERTLPTLLAATQSGFGTLGRSALVRLGLLRPMVPVALNYLQVPELESQLILQAFDAEPGDTLYHLVNALARAANLVMLERGIQPDIALRKRGQLQAASWHVCEDVLKHFTEGMSLLDAVRDLRGVLSGDSSADGNLARRCIERS